VMSAAACAEKASAAAASANLRFLFMGTSFLG
jgi:hypothetical protein